MPHRDPAMMKISKDDNGRAGEVAASAVCVGVERERRRQGSRWAGVIYPPVSQEVS